VILWRSFCELKKDYLWFFVEVVGSLVVVLDVKRGLLSFSICWRFVLGGLFIFYVLLDFDVLVYSSCFPG